MARYKPIERGQGYFLTIFPGLIFEDNSIEKVIDKFIDEIVDTSVFDAKYHNDIAGQKAIPPKSKLKVIIYALSQGIESLRRIDKLLKLNHPAYLLLSGGITINYSTLSIFINTFPDEISGIFARVIYILEELKMIDWDRIMIDGTRVSSNASKNFTDDAKGFAKKLERYENLSAKLLARAQYIEELAEKDEIREEEVKKEKDLIAKQQNQYNLTINKLQAYENELKEKEKKEDDLKKQSKLSSVKINLTDSESKLLEKHGTFVQGYNVQAAFSSNDILLSIEATSESNDKTMLKYMVNNVENLKEKHMVESRSQYLLDKGYFNGKEMTELIKEGKDLYIAPSSTFTSSWFITGEHEIKEEDDGVFLQCKGGLRKKGTFKTTTKSYEFSMKRSKCEGCEYFSSCFENNSAKKKLKEKKCRVFSVTEEYVKNKDFWFKYRDLVETEEWKFVYNKRIGKEHNFFDLKYNNGLNRINFRGKSKCNSIALLSGTSYNLKKLQKGLGNRSWDEVKKVIEVNN